MSRPLPGDHDSYWSHHDQDQSSEESEEEQDPSLVSWKNDLAESLQAIQSFGDFATKKDYSQFVNPGLQIADCLIPLPLVFLYAEQIKAVSRPAPFGRGDDTVVDHSVRLTWEIHLDEIRITNPAWPGFLDAIKHDAAHSLGLFPADIRLEPHKLLLYEEGSFFRRHKDSEKSPGMIGSLIICLPSKHEGGQVHLSHAGKDHVYATAPNSAFNLTALAWYSDVTHEIKEVTAGHRLVLTYNIVQRAGGGKSAGFFVQQQAQLKDKIARWPRAFSNVSRLVYFFDHKYSHSSLSVNNLKGRDRAVLEVVQQLCSESGLYLLLGNVTKRKYDQTYGDIEEEPDVFLELLCTPEGKRVASDLDMSKQDIIGSDPYRDRSADSEDEGEFVGNESAPTQWRYHDSAMVLIPRDKLQNLIESGAADPWAMITIVMDCFRSNPQNANVRKHVLQFMSKTPDSHRPATNPYGFVPTEMAPWKTISMTIVTVAWNLGDIPLYSKAIRSCTAGGDIPGELVTKLAALINKSSSTPQPADWDKCLGGLLDCPIDLTRLFTALGEFERALQKEAFKDSFKEWITPARRAKFESKPSLTLEDHDFIIDLTTALWNDQGWVQQQFMAKLHHCENKALITKVIGTLAEKGRANNLPGGEIIAEQILDNELPRLYLAPVNWWTYPNPRAAVDTDRFLDLVGICLESGFIAHATDLVENLDKITQQPIWMKPAHVGVVGFVPNQAHLLVRNLGNLLNEHQAPFMESARGLFEHLLRNYALAPLPVYPTRTEGWAHQPRGCIDPFCVHCRKLDDFLTSPLRRTAEFTAAKQVRDHIARQLTGNLFDCATNTRGRTHTLVVTKLSQEGEYDAAVYGYGARARALRQQTADFRHEHFRRILGDGLYRELVLVEGPPGLGVPGDPVEQQQAAGVGRVKREADTEMGVPPALRRRVN
ncbi:hypothetical protein VMCG_06678 [Cytospora schulzeri]|uniref:Prolyl 4-hydroxylase alpha subunit Fe(2+) 2OG dioxygenase domain-containing protein n=1 Tax=Cytospora schulzeri TaxID=448051 RepID=A0A423W6Y3_9PEZI|nr:hypothetical protein VMCG_06678 [Valsa malicola]